MSLTFYNNFWNFGDDSNLRAGTNPPYTISDFTAFYPQFGNDSQGNPVVPPAVIQTFITMANAKIQQTRWRSEWSFAMGLLVAHYCTLWLQTQVSPDNGGAGVAQAGQAQGVVANESAGDVSVGYDPKLPGADSPLLAGWGDLHLTTYGQQLLSRARMVGKGGMFIY